MIRHLYGSVRTAFLALVGFTLTTVGLNTTDAAPQKLANHLVVDITEARIATACMPEQKESRDDEIFFLSCGGLF